MKDNTWWVTARHGMRGWQWPDPQTPPAAPATGGMGWAVPPSPRYESEQLCDPNDGFLAQFGETVAEDMTSPSASFAYWDALPPRHRLPWRLRRWLAALRAR